MQTPIWFNTKFFFLRAFALANRCLCAVTRIAQCKDTLLVSCNVYCVSACFSLLLLQYRSSCHSFHFLQTSLKVHFTICNNFNVDVGTNRFIFYHKLRKIVDWNWCNEWKGNFAFDRCAGQRKQWWCSHKYVSLAQLFSVCWKLNKLHCKKFLKINTRRDWNGIMSILMLHKWLPSFAHSISNEMKWNAPICASKFSVCVNLEVDGNVQCYACG